MDGNIPLFIRSCFDILVFKFISLNIYFFVFMIRGSHFECNELI